MSFSILIIAAGSSSRLGHPKQLLPFKDGNLLTHTIKVCKESEIGNIHLILGANYETILEQTKTTDCKVHINQNWKQGMGNSIAFGIQQISENIEGVIITVGDQPFLEKENLKQLISTFQKASAGIIVSKYDTGTGPPTFFSKKYFNELSQLSGDKGAKVIIKKHFEFVRFVSFAKGSIDIDTEEDLRFLK